MTIPQISGYGNFINPYLAYLNPQMNNWNNYGYYNPAFMGAQNIPQTVSVPQPNITPQVQSNAVNFKASEQIQPPQKEGLSKGAKWGIGLGVTALAATGVYLATRGKVGSKQVKQLAEHIEFKPAKTVDEAIAWGKENLGIIKYEGFGASDLSVINWVNEGLVNNSNKMKGKLKMPRLMWYTDALDGNTLAGMSSKHTGKNAKYNDYFLINKNIFNNLDDEISKRIKNISKGNLLSLEKDGTLYYAHRDIDEITPLITKIYKHQNGELKNFNEKLDLFQDVSSFIDEHNRVLNFPDKTIKEILDIDEFKKLLSSKNLETDLKAINKFDLKKKQELLVNMLNELEERVIFQHKSKSIFHTIYHELGHLQDDVVRIEAVGKYKDASMYPKELREWLDNKEMMQTASKISDYATTGPGEFIAETYAYLIEGRKLSDDVMALYKKLGGPALA